MNQLLFSDDMTLAADSKRKLQKLVTVSGSACNKRELRINANKG